MNLWSGLVVGAALVGLAAGVLGSGSRSAWRFGWGGIATLIVLISTAFVSNSPIQGSSDVSKNVLVAVAGIALGVSYYVGLTLSTCARFVSRRH